MSRIELRPYQTEAVQAIYDYYINGNTGNAIVVLPTGAGKSLTMASFIRSAIEQYPSTRILLLAHVRELLVQNTRAIVRYWPEAPVGIWSAGLNQKQKAQVTVAGIQSIHKLPTKFADTDIIIIDECHLLRHKQDTTYRRFIDGIKAYNPALKVIGFTATEFRQDSGLLTEGDGHLFDDVCYKADVGDLIKQGYLCPLVTKGGATKADLSGVHTRGGDYIPAELQDAMDKAELIHGAIQETESFAADRKHILGFCSGVAHAKNCAEIARSRGHVAEYLSGDMPTDERDAILHRFTSGQTRMLFNANILTTGFDFEAIDCILMLRPTKSTGLYMQCMGRGLRKHPSKENTLVLDFAEVIKTHGPIDQIRVKRKGAKGDSVSVAPVRECPGCHELLHPSIPICPQCGFTFPVSAKHGTEAADAVIVAALEKPRVYAVDRVEYENYKKAGKPLSIKVTYYCGVSTFNEWIPICDERAYIKKHAVSWFLQRGMMCPNTVDAALQDVRLDKVPAPFSIEVKADGKYFRVTNATMKMNVCIGQTFNETEIFGQYGVSTVVEREKAFWEQVE
jgi:DNA repair protein RadD